MREGYELKVRKTEQGSLLVLEHLEDVLYMKGSSVKAEAERFDDIGSESLQKLVVIKYSRGPQTARCVQNYELVEPFSQYVSAMYSA